MLFCVHITTRFARLFHMACTRYRTRHHSKVTIVLPEDRSCILLRGSQFIFLCVGFGVRVESEHLFLWASSCNVFDFFLAEILCCQFLKWWRVLYTAWYLTLLCLPLAPRSLLSGFLHPPRTRTGIPNSCPRRRVLRRSSLRPPRRSSRSWIR